MSNKFTASIPIHNFKLKIITNDSGIFQLLNEQLDFTKFKQSKKCDFKIVFNLEKVDFYKIPQTKFDIFKEYPLFQQENIADNTINLNVGFRTLRISIDPKNNYVHAYIAYGQDILDRNLFFDLVFFQPLRFILRFHKIYIIHAGSVAKDSRAILLPGEAGSGKSVVSLSLVRKGYKYLSDDDTFLQQKGNIVECFSFYCNPKIKDVILKYFPEIKKKCLKSIKQDKKQRIDLKKYLPDSIQTKAIPRLIIFSHFNPKSKTKILPVDKQYALKRLIKDKFRIFQGRYEDISKLHFLTLSNLVKQTKTYKLFYKDQDIDRIPELVEKLL